MERTMTEVSPPQVNEQETSDKQKLEAKSLEESDGLSKEEDKIIKTKAEKSNSIDKISFSMLEQNSPPLIQSDLDSLKQNPGWELIIGESQILLKPKMTKDVSKEDGGAYIDQEVITNGFSDVFPSSEGDLHRGITEGELKDIVESGFIQSKGDRVVDIAGDESKTFFTSLLSEAKNYAEKPGRIPAARQPGFGHSNYIVSLSKEFSQSIDQADNNSEVGIEGKISADNIISIIEIRPRQISTGTIPIQQRDTCGKYINDSIINNWENAPMIEFVYRKVNLEELKINPTTLIQ